MARRGYAPEFRRRVVDLVEGGRKVSEVATELEVSEQTIYTWRKKYAGLAPSELQRLKQLENENQKLKGLVADLSLDKQILQDVLAKKL